MVDLFNAAVISLGSVVLDTPDRTGRYIMKDMAGGWAYLVADDQGDNRFRGQGVCAGGLDVTLRYAFLSAANWVPGCKTFRIYVETRQMHRAMVRLATADSHIVAAIAGRPVSIMTRPRERSLFQVRSAAERAALAALRDRERTEREEAAADALSSALRTGGAADAIAEVEKTASGPRRPVAMQSWRAGLGAGTSDVLAVSPTGESGVKRAAPVVPFAFAAGLSLIRPFVERTRNGFTAAGKLTMRRPPRSGDLTDWLKEFDRNIAVVGSNLQDVGA